MEEFTGAINNLVTLLIVIGGSLFTLCVAGGAILYMTASGDPRKQELARAALLSSVIGVIMLSMAPLLPRVLSRFVIEPAGGRALERVHETSCDDTFRTGLIEQRAVSGDDRANAMVRQIQAQRDEDCDSETWDPRVTDEQTCQGGNSGNIQIGETLVPKTLLDIARADLNVQTPGGSDTDDGLTRDARGNMLVNFKGDRRPTDGSKCWLYLAGVDIWDQGSEINLGDRTSPRDPPPDPSNP